MDRLPLRVREDLSENGARKTRVLVCCPQLDAWTSVAACRACPDCLHLSTPAREEDTIVLCVRERAAPRGEDLLSHAARCPALDLAEERLVVTSADARAGDVARRLRASGGEAAVVVEAGGTLLGMLPVENVTDARDSEPARACVEPAIVGVLEEANAMDVLALMLTRACNHVSVLSHGQVVGIITARSALAWLAAFRRQAP